MIYPQDFESKIGFDTIRKILIQNCQSRLAREFAEEMAFSADFNDVMHKLGSVREMIEIKRESLPFPGFSTHDVIPYLNEIKAINSFMSADRLYKLMVTLMAFADLKSFFDSHKSGDEYKPEFPELCRDIEPLIGFPMLVKQISTAINKFGEIKDTASPALYEIRKSIKNANGSMQRAMRRVLDRAVASGVVDKDTSPSIRDGRLVIPVTAGQKRQINGIVHDESATGKTVFIEPAEVVEAGNRLRELQIEEKREETAVLISIAAEIRPYIDDIAASCRVQALLEFIDAKAMFAIDVNAQMPHIVSHPEIEWYHAVHPALFLSLRKQKRAVVPLDLTLSEQRRILIISGPNAGGKSVCLKTVAVVQYMMQCGLLPTLYDNSHMGFFKKLFIDIGDEQSFENDLSTYSSHLRNMRFFLLNADRNTLLLADEMGSGTEPLIGGAMAQAILDQLGKSHCYGIVTTHYQNLKTFADNTDGFVNGAMLYDRARLEPTFQLSVGNAGSSFAIDIAHKMGLPRNVIEDAKRIVGDDYVNLDKYLSDIARDRKYWSNKRLNIKEKETRLDNLLSKYEEVAGDLKLQRKAILDDARKEAAEILSTANARIERTILEIRKAQAEKEKTKKLRQDLKDFTQETVAPQKDDIPAPIKDLKHKSRKPKKEIENKVVNEKRPIAAGDFVKMENSSSVGKVLSISGNKAEVAFGALRTFVTLPRLTLTLAPKTSGLSSAPTVTSSTTDDSRRRQLNFRNEIDVRGMRGDEAVQAVVYFIDDAIQFNAGKVRILHGTGHGILKTLIRQQLKCMPGVESFDDEDIRFGGAGITVVNLS